MKPKLGNSPVNLQMIRDFIRRVGAIFKSSTGYRKTSEFEFIDWLEDGNEELDIEWDEISPKLGIDTGE